MDELKKYLQHLPICNLRQDWSEAVTAMADTPRFLRDEGWDKGMTELYLKMSSCSCGLSKLMEKIEAEKKL